MATTKRAAKPTTSRRPVPRPSGTRRAPAKPETFWSIMARQRQRPPRVFIIGGGGLS